MHITIVIDGIAYVIQHGIDDPPEPLQTEGLEVKRVVVKDVEAFEKALEKLISKHKRKE